jgi:hypothetical protein
MDHNGVHLNTARSAMQVIAKDGSVRSHFPLTLEQTQRVAAALATLNEARTK